MIRKTNIMSAHYPFTCGVVITLLQMLGPIVAQGQAGVFSPSATAIIPSAIGRLKLGPSFLMSAGARLIVVRLRDHLYALLAIAVRARSLLSFTAGAPQATQNQLSSPPAALAFVFSSLCYTTATS